MCQSIDIKRELNIIQLKDKQFINKFNQFNKWFNNLYNMFNNQSKSCNNQFINNLFINNQFNMFNNLLLMHNHWWHPELFLKVQLQPIIHHMFNNSNHNKFHNKLNHNNSNRLQDLTLPHNETIFIKTKFMLIFYVSQVFTLRLLFQYVVVKLNIIVLIYFYVDYHPFIYIN